MAKRFKPDYGEEYWTVGSTGEIGRNQNDVTSWMRDHYDFGNCFKTRHEAEMARLKIKSLLREINNAT